MDMLEVQFAAALSLLREGGSPAVKPLLDILNRENLALTDEDCLARAHPVRLVEIKSLSSPKALFI